MERRIDKGKRLMSENEHVSRHILALSGGKDSAALAIYMKDRVPNMEYVFCDTEKELDETYEYLDRLEVYFGKKIVRLKGEGLGFDDLLEIRRGFLPSPQMRWCTECKFQNYLSHFQNYLPHLTIGVS